MYIYIYRERERERIVKSSCLLNSKSNYFQRKKKLSLKKSSLHWVKYKLHTHRHR